MVEPASLSPLTDHRYGVVCLYLLCGVVLLLDACLTLLQHMDLGSIEQKKL